MLPLGRGLARGLSKAVPAVARAAEGIGRVSGSVARVAQRVLPDVLAEGPAAVRLAGHRVEVDLANSLLPRLGRQAESLLGPSKVPVAAESLVGIAERRIRTIGQVALEEAANARATSKPIAQHKVVLETESLDSLEVLAERCKAVKNQTSEAAKEADREAVELLRIAKKAEQELKAAGENVPQELRDKVTKCFEDLVLAKEKQEHAWKQLLDDSASVALADFKVIDARCGRAKDDIREARSAFDAAKQKGGVKPEELQKLKDIEMQATKNHLDLEAEARAKLELKNKAEKAQMDANVLESVTRDAIRFDLDIEAFLTELTGPEELALAREHLFDALKAEVAKMPGKEGPGLKMDMAKAAFVKRCRELQATIGRTPLMGEKAHVDRLVEASKFLEQYFPVRLQEMRKLTGITVEGKFVRLLERFSTGRSLKTAEDQALARKDIARHYVGLVLEAAEKRHIGHIGLALTLGAGALLTRTHISDMVHELVGTEQHRANACAKIRGLLSTCVSEIVARKNLKRETDQLLSRKQQLIKDPASAVEDAKLYIIGRIEREVAQLEPSTPLPSAKAAAAYKALENTCAECAKAADVFFKERDMFSVKWASLTDEQKSARIHAWVLAGLKEKGEVVQEAQAGGLFGGAVQESSNLTKGKKELTQEIANALAEQVSTDLLLDPTPMSLLGIKQEQIDAEAKRHDEGRKFTPVTITEADLPRDIIDVKNFLGEAGSPLVLKDNSLQIDATAILKPGTSSLTLAIERTDILRQRLADAKTSRLEQQEERDMAEAALEKTSRNILQEAYKDVLPALELATMTLLSSLEDKKEAFQEMKSLQSVYVEQLRKHMNTIISYQGVKDPKRLSGEERKAAEAMAEEYIGVVSAFQAATYVYRLERLKQLPEIVTQRRDSAVKELKEYARLAGILTKYNRSLREEK